MKKSAYRKDIGRCISHGKKRFFSIVVITVLGVMMFSGLQASCQDLRGSADRFFDGQRLHDIAVQSTLGLTDADVDALAGADGVEAAEGIYEEDEDIRLADGTSAGVTLSTLTDSGIDAPYLTEGRLPQSTDETAVTEKFAKDTGLGIILHLPSIYLAVHLHTISYVYAAGLTLLFALLVQLMTNRTLDRIDPATALKSME